MLRIRTFINGNWYTQYRKDQIRKLRKIGAYTRQAGRSELKTRKGTSQPGQAPFAHGRKLKGAVRFAVDEMAMSVVTGPETGASRVAEIIEKGGVSKISGGDRAGQPVRIEARPWMTPAQTKTLPAIARIIGE